MGELPARRYASLVFVGKPVSQSRGRVRSQGGPREVALKWRSVAVSYLRFIRVKVWNRLTKDISRTLGRVFSIRRPGGTCSLRRMGSAYGGWWIPADLLSADSVAYCVGAGVDITFDLAINKEFGCHVWVFDPSPQSVEFIAGLELPPRVTFVPVGLARQDGSVKFFFDRRREQLSVFDVDATGEVAELPVKRLVTIMREFGHESIDLLKIDIEGGWNDVLIDLLDSGVRPRLLLIEFDTPVRPLQFVMAMVRLRNAGYKLLKREKDNFVFVARGFRGRVAHPAESSSESEGLSHEPAEPPSQSGGRS